jgi:hypothetical protein
VESGGRAFVMAEIYEMCAAMFRALVRDAHSWPAGHGEKRETEVEARCTDGQQQFLSEQPYVHSPIGIDTHFANSALLSLSAIQDAREPVCLIRCQRNTSDHRWNASAPLVATTH